MPAPLLGYEAPADVYRTRPDGSVGAGRAGRARCDLIDMTGARLGHLTVLGIGPNKRFPSGVHRRMWVVRCDCGHVFNATGIHLRGTVHRLGINRCRYCHAEDSRIRGKRERSVKLPGGKTIAQIADAAGLPLDTVYHRFLRGWPVAKLGLPLRPKGVKKGAKGIGAAVYLEERRGLVLGRRTEAA